MTAKTILCTAAILLAGAAAPVAEARDGMKLKRATEQTLSETDALAGIGDPQSLRQALMMIDERLSKKRLPDRDRAALLKARGDLRLTLTPEAPGAAFADYEVAAGLGVLPDDMVRDLRERRALFAMQRGGVEAGLRYWERHADDYGRPGAEREVDKANLLLKAGAFERAAALLAPRVIRDDAGSDLLATFYGAQLGAGRVDEARATLDRLSDLWPYYDATGSAIEAHERAAAQGAISEDHAALAEALRMEMRAEDAMIQPTERVPPRGFQSCLRGGGLETVSLRFDVLLDGTVVNPSVTDTTNPCLNEASVRALRQWRFDVPPSREEAAGDTGFARRGVRTRIKYGQR